jgi:RNA polymerase sigma-70 factor (ECF subfamily)
MAGPAPLHTLGALVAGALLTSSAPAAAFGHPSGASMAAMTAASRDSDLVPSRVEPAADPRVGQPVPNGVAWPDTGDQDRRTVDEPPTSAEHAETWRLVRLAQRGDGEAFGQLYDRYVETVYRFVYFRVGERGLAEDFTSETFLRALRRIGTVSYQGRDIGAWFVTIARNIVLDHSKSARVRLEVVAAETPEPARSEPSTEQAVLTSLTNARLLAAVNELGDEQRECVMLRFIQGFSVSETAEVMGKNEGAVKALQHRAVRKLADLVGEELR